ncbi:spore germination protein [Paludifilum halophilum]|uniref:Spore germination protein n=1 Tax=Paludifilum halophilum TaxID=1642702 RepID=A0A235B270_9BACL|nr:spore germination protein [Paludifilum halophilum]OYD06416.1 spore germination protein [Paludifilum halophilum]
MRKSYTRKRERRKKEYLKDRSERKLDEKVGGLRVYTELEKNLQFISQLLGDATDLVSRRFTIQYTPNRRAAVVYLDGMVEVAIVDEFVLHPLMTEAENIRSKSDIWKTVRESLVQTGEMETTRELKTMVDSLLSGDTLLFVDGCSEGLALGTKGWARRAVKSPRSENVVRGPREGLTETLRVNTSMIRRRLKDPDLRLKDFKKGKRTKTHITLMYIEGVADDAVVKEAKQRMKQIEIDGVLETGYIEEMIEDNTWSPFPQIQNTERPDTVVSHLLEGKVAILVDGTPHALIIPAIFSQFYYSAEDYYERYTIASFLRVLRLVSLFIALLLPTLYIAFISFHVEMIPSDLAITLAAGRATVPFPSIVEALVMEVSVEILREASVRLPGMIGPTIGIVGALVVGQAAVEAGLVSPLMVIVVGLTTISSYATPSYSAAISIRLLRFPFMIVSATLGLFGVVLALLLMLLHLIKLRSFGVPYLAPFTPLHLSDLKDTVLRMPWRWMKKRPVIYRPGDDRRQRKEMDGT